MGIQDNRLYWDSETFEDNVARGLIAIYETPWEKNKKRHPASRVLESDIEKLKRIGPYFAPYDREWYADSFDASLDGFPSIATAAFPSLPGGEFYLHWLFAKREKQFPSDVIRTGGGDPFSLFVIHASGGRGLVAERLWVSVSNDGKIYGTNGRVKSRFGNLILRDNTNIASRVSPTDVGYGANVGNAVYLSSMTFNLWNDRQTLWNVEATDGKARATFGVYMEQVKSLFYCRDLPITNTGRKRPILHWVSAHRRRMALGTDINIDKYLRGIISFEMSGTLFTISRPIKNNQRERVVDG